MIPAGIDCRVLKKECGISRLPKSAKNELSGTIMLLVFIVGGGHSSKSSPEIRHASDRS
jgi:hypothetical protein